MYPDYKDDLFLATQQEKDLVSPLNTMMESLSVSSLDSTLVDSSLADSTLAVDLTQMDSNTDMIKEEQSNTTTTTTTKKKLWPFTCLFKKRSTLPTPMTPPTPVLSPEHDSLQPSNSSNSSSPFEDIIKEGTWAFTYPTLIPMIPAVWIKFDIHNQKKISDQVRSAIPMIQFTDSHIGNNNVLITVIPSQMACFIPFSNQFTRLELNYVPPILQQQQQQL